MYFFEKPFCYITAVKTQDWPLTLVTWFLICKGTKIAAYLCGSSESNWVKRMLCQLEAKWDEESPLTISFRATKAVRVYQTILRRSIQKWILPFPDLLQSFGFSYDLSMGFSKAELFLSLTFSRIKSESSWRLGIKFKTEVKGPFLLLPCH